jgi:DNA-binding response OmpR family regulator
MPGLSGADTVRFARRTWPALKALFISGYADRSCFEGELDNDVVLKKPFELETLVAAVRTALHRNGTASCHCSENGTSRLRPSLRQGQLGRASQRILRKGPPVSGIGRLMPSRVGKPKYKAGVRHKNSFFRHM